MKLSSPLWVPVCFGAATMILVLAGRQAEASPLDTAAPVNASAAPPGAAHVVVPRRPAATRASAHPLFSSPDATPPVLNSISVAGTPNMTMSNPSVTVTLDISDDLTGFTAGVIVLQSPDGRQVAQEIYEGGAPLHVVHKEQMGYSRGGAYSPTSTDVFDHWSQPGTWTVSAVYLSDAAGNAVWYDAGQLAALGGTGFTVLNAKYDGITPALVSGRILTPKVSLSAGSDHGVPLVKTQVTMTDSGSGSTAGVDYVALYYCLPPVDADGTCSDYVQTYAHLGVPSTGAHATVTTSDIAYSWILNPDGTAKLATPGTYQLVIVQLISPDGFSSGSWTSTLVGGPDDLSAYFPSTALTITP